MPNETREEAQSEAGRARQMMARLRLQTITSAIVSASASIVAIGALATAVYQTKLARDQAHATVRPYLILGNSGNNGYARIVQNVGLGPAIVGAFEVRVDGHPVKDWHEAAESMHVAPSWKGHATTTFIPGIVAPTGSIIELLDLPDSNDAKLFRAALSKHDLDTWVCYCSLYGDCWQSNKHTFYPIPTDKCVEIPSRTFRE